MMYGDLQQQQQQHGGGDLNHHQHLSATGPPMPSYDAHADGFAAKRMRKHTQRRAVDYTSTVVRYMQIRMWQQDSRDQTMLQPTPAAAIDMLPTGAYADNPSTSFAAKFVHTSVNKNRCSINRVLVMDSDWTTTDYWISKWGIYSVEWTVLNFRVLRYYIFHQAHDKAIRSMVWSHNDNWMVSGDDGGAIKYWQNNMNNVKANKTAHKESIRDLRTDLKFCSCSDDTTVKVWDFARCQEERILNGKVLRVLTCMTMYQSLYRPTPMSIGNSPTSSSPTERNRTSPNSGNQQTTGVGKKLEASQMDYDQNYHIVMKLEGDEQGFVLEFLSFELDI
ncbi:hypothetical protein G4B88_007885 [Cannabis sativa]|uniref:Uncharacterized protein n=1 Tax=Cannabis sativa TaxID=3483 RepID=A0A7J6DRY1_CANSA|nr:hypothetical protein G4B88_007885 [Cannabis sativa]